MVYNRRRFEMKRILLLFFAFLISQIVVAQDVIITKQSERIDAKIIKVSETEIEYKQSNNLEGPTFTMSVSKIASIMYSNGSVQTFNLKGGSKESISFTRGKGFVIRPEFYRGIYVSFGYQFSPYFQTFLGVGYGEGLDGLLGIRVYTGDAKWAAMFDLRAGLTEYVLPNASLVAGASYKDFDFGAGVKFYEYYTEADYIAYLFVPVISIGWNIRLYEHR